MPNLYELPGTREAAEITDKAASNLQEARDASNTSGQYLANTVLFAMVLFFADTAGKFEAPRVRLYSAAFGVAVFVLPSSECSSCPRPETLSFRNAKTKYP